MFMMSLKSKHLAKELRPGKNLAESEVQNEDLLSHASTD